jgi:hypothetical protein
MVNGRRYRDRGQRRDRRLAGWHNGPWRGLAARQGFFVFSLLFRIGGKPQGYYGGYSATEHAHVSFSDATNRALPDRVSLLSSVGRALLRGIYRVIT